MESNLSLFQALCAASNRCIEAGVEYNIGLTVQDGTRTPQEGLELMEKVSYGLELTADEARDCNLD